MVAAMIQLQLLAGMRPGEVVILRAIDLDMTGKVWLYRPGSDQGQEGTHKTAYRGHQRIVPIGPRGQEIIRRFLQPDLYAYLFSPRQAVEELRVNQRQARKTPVQPSQVNRRKRKPKRFPGNRYTVGSYAVAIGRGCLKATQQGVFQLLNDLRSAGRHLSLPDVLTWETFKRPSQLTEERIETLVKTNGLEKEIQRLTVPHWHPHQLRHTKATEIRREYGIDSARAVLGHRSPVVTEVYAELDTGKATEVMERLG
jgi:integrase